MENSKPVGIHNETFAISDPYVKVWLQFGDKRIEKRKTPIFKCTLNPIFNEVFSFNVPWEKIRECSLDVMVMDFDNIGRNELIGRIQLAGISRTLRDNVIRDLCYTRPRFVEKAQKFQSILGF